MIGVVIRWDGMFEAARLLGGCRSTGSGASCNRSLREAREAREAFRDPSLGGSLGPSPAQACQGQQGVQGLARARLAGLPGSGRAGHAGRGRPQSTIVAQGHPLICARVLLEGFQGSIRRREGRKRGSARPDSCGRCVRWPLLAADGRSPSPAAGFHVPFLATALLPLGGPLAHAPPGEVVL